jgi:hypothetical protein
MVICFFVSTLFSVPSILGMILYSSKKVLILGFFSISMTFFLFSYHVHEKSILLPLLMAPFLVKYFCPKLIKHLVISGCVGNYKFNFRNVSLIEIGWSINSIFLNADSIHHNYGGFFSVHCCLKIFLIIT